MVYIFVYHGCEISKISYDKQTLREQKISTVNDFQDSQRGRVSKSFRCDFLL